MLILIFIAVTGMRIVADVLECFDNPVLPFQGWTSTPSPIIRQKPDPIAAMANHVQLRGGLIGIDVAVQKFQVKYESDIYIYISDIQTGSSSCRSKCRPAVLWMEGCTLEEHLAQITELRREEDTAVICGIETDTQKVRIRR